MPSTRDFFSARYRLFLCQHWHNNYCQEKWIFPSPGKASIVFSFTSEQMDDDDKDNQMSHQREHFLRSLLNNTHRRVETMANRRALTTHRSLLRLDTDYDDDGLETFKRYKPRSLDELASRTKFSKKEIQLIYQGFKQECPSGKRVDLSFLWRHFSSRACQWGHIQTYLRTILSVCRYVDVRTFGLRHVRPACIWLCHLRRFSRLPLHTLSRFHRRSSSMDLHLVRYEEIWQINPRGKNDESIEHLCEHRPLVWKGFSSDCVCCLFSPWQCLHSTLRSRNHSRTHIDCLSTLRQSPARLSDHSRFHHVLSKRKSFVVHRHQWSVTVLCLGSCSPPIDRCPTNNCVMMISSWTQ